MRGMDFDTTCHDARIFRAGRPQLHLAADCHNPLIAQRISRLVRSLRGGWIDDHLHQPGSISHIEEYQPAMVAATMNPAGKTHDLTRVRRREFSTIM